MNMFASSPWLWWAILSAFFAAVTTIFGKLGLKDVDADLAQCIRTATVFLITIAAVTWNGTWPAALKLDGKTHLFLALSGVATGLSWICFFRALKMGEASRIAPVDKLSVVMVAIFAAWFLGEHLGVRGWCGVGLMVAGALLLIVHK
jgi:transporter family protein